MEALKHSQNTFTMIRFPFVPMAKQLFFYIIYIYLRQYLFEFLTDLLHWLLSQRKAWITNTCRVNTNKQRACPILSTVIPRNR